MYNNFSFNIIDGINYWGPSLNLRCNVIARNGRGVRGRPKILNMSEKTGNGGRNQISDNAYNIEQGKWLVFFFNSTNNF